MRKKRALQSGELNPSDAPPPRLELTWPGKAPTSHQAHAPVPRSAPFTQTDAVPGSLPAIPGEFRNRLVLGDNLLMLHDLRREFPGQIDLIYIDPPFNLGNDLTMNVTVGDQSIKLPAYSDTWEHGAASYAQMMHERLTVMRDLLAPTGSLYVHCDYRTNALFRLILDEIFGADHFCNEIIWHYQSGGRQRNRFSMKHDTLLLYTRSTRWTFNLREVAERRGTGKRNNMKREVDPDGRVCFTIKSAGKIYKYYEDEWLTPSDVWTNISHIQQKDPQRCGYPTQKPEALLERIIRASSNPGDLVADFFCGSGTTGVVAEKLDRRWLLCDQSPPAIAASLKRMLQLRQAREAGGMPWRGFDVYNQHEDTEPGGDDLYAEIIPAESGFDVRLTGFKPRLTSWTGPFSPLVLDRTATGNLDLIDAWAVDFDWKPDRPFRVDWSAQRSRAGRDLRLTTNAPHACEHCGEHWIGVKVWDVLGRSTLVPVRSQRAGGAHSL